MKKSVKGSSVKDRMLGVDAEGQQETQDEEMLQKLTYYE